MATSRYWTRQFAKFDASKGRFVPTWSWAALIFGFFWYLWKGMWPKLLILIMAVSLLAALPEKNRGIILLVWLLYPAMFGKWDYYLQKKRGTYFW